MRPTLLAAATLALTVLAAPAQAVPDRDPGATAPDARRAGLSCSGGVLGITSDRHVVSYDIDNGEVTTTRRSKDQLHFRATALGYRASSSTKRASTFDANVMAQDGVPRRVLMTSPAANDNIRLETRRYDQKNFAPDLFADGYSPRAYTTGGGRLTRWVLTKYPDGDVRYDYPVTVATTLGLTSLQTGYVFKVDGVWKEFLYATTRRGELLQIEVPIEHPRREKITTLADEGYDGVTELAWAYCNDNVKSTLLFAVDPVADTATWTTVKRTTTDHVTRNRGELTGTDVSWDLVAAY